VPVADGQYINNHHTELNQSKVMTVSISGCVSGKFCRCFDAEGSLIDLPELSCRNYAEGNLALPIKITYQQEEQK
jgi:hypothetical protein